MNLKLAGLLGGVVLVLALVAGLLFFRGEAIKAKAETAEVQGQLTTALAVNDANAKALERLDKQARANEALLTAMQAEVKEINSRAASTNEALTKLRRENAEIKAYLDGRVPADVRGLLNAPARR